VVHPSTAQPHNNEGNIDTSSGSRREGDGGNVDDGDCGDVDRRGSERDRDSGETEATASVGLGLMDDVLPLKDLSGVLAGLPPMFDDESGEKGFI